MKKKCKNLLLILSVALCPSLGFSQAPGIQWQKTYGGSSFEEAKSIQQTSDGGYILAGYSNSNNGDVTGNHGNSDFWVVKVDAQNNLEWQKSYGGSANDVANCVIQTSDGGYILTGSSNSNNGDVDENHGMMDIWTLKIDAYGNEQWQDVFGGSSSDRGRSVVQTSDGGFLVAGSSRSTDGDFSSGNKGSYDVILLKYNANGTVAWKKNYGGTSAEFVYCVNEGSNGGYIIACSSFSNNGDVIGNQGGLDYWVIKTDANGNIQWSRTYGGSKDDEARSVIPTSDGGYIIAGHSESNHAYYYTNYRNYDYWVVKIDVNGNIEWSKSYGGIEDERVASIEQTNDGGYVVAGTTGSHNGDVTGFHGNTAGIKTSDYWLVKISAFGSLQWQRALGGYNEDECTGMVLTSGGGYTLAGWTRSNNGDVSGKHGSDDFWLLKLQHPKLIEEQCGQAISINGNFICEPFEGASYYMITVTNNGGPYYNRTSYNSGGINTLPKSFFPGMQVGRNYFVTVNTKVGNTWYYGSPCNVYFDYYGGNGFREVRPGLSVKPASLALNLYPNPANRDGFNFNLTGLREQTNQIQIDVYDLYGKQVYKEQFTHSDSELQKRLSFNEALSSGVYLVRVNVNGEVLQEKIQVQ